MANYNNRQLGEIAIFRNLIFRNNNADHASLKGRPCLILSESIDKLYIAPLTHRKGRCKLYQFSISQKNILYESSYPVIRGNEYVSLTDIMERDICGYNPVGYVDEEIYYILINKILNMNLVKFPNSYECIRKIRNDLIEQKKYLKKKIN